MVDEQWRSMECASGLMIEKMRNHKGAFVVWLYELAIMDDTFSKRRSRSLKTSAVVTNRS